jgi:hypothetical protein
VSGKNYDHRKVMIGARKGVRTRCH